MGEYAVGADKASVDTERGESIFGDGPDERTRSFAILSSQGPDLHIVTRLEHVQHDDAVCDDAQPHARQRTGDESASRTGPRKMVSRSLMRLTAVRAICSFSGERIESFSKNGTSSAMGEPLESRMPPYSRMTPARRESSSKSLRAVISDIPKIVAAWATVTIPR